MPDDRPFKWVVTSRFYDAKGERIGRLFKTKYPATLYARTLNRLYDSDEFVVIAL